MGRIKKIVGVNALSIRDELEFTTKKMNFIQGENGTGKSSVLEIIQKGFTGKSKRKEFVNKDSDEAIIEIELDSGINIKRNIKKDGKERLTVEQNGEKVNAPATFLKKLLGNSEYNFSPTDFIQEDPKKRKEMLLKVLDVDFKPEDVDKEFGEKVKYEININRHPLEFLKDIEKYFYDLRKDANTEVRNTKTELEGLQQSLPENYDKDKWENFSIKELYEKIESAKTHNEKVAEAKRFIENVDKDIADRKEKVENYLIAQEDKTKVEIQDLENQIKALQRRIEDKKENLKSIKTEKKEQMAEYEKNKLEEKKEAEKIAKQPILDYIELEKEAEKADEMRSFIKTANYVEQLSSSLEEKEKIAKDYDEKVKRAREIPGELLAKAKIPIEGLEIHGDDITINGLPIENLNTSQIIRLSVDIAKLLSGEIKVILIDRFESLSDKSKKEFYEAVKDDEFTYFIAEVTDSDTLQIRRSDLK
jgi:exonuclease SbcC